MFVFRTVYKNSSLMSNLAFQAAYCFLDKQLKLTTTLKIIILLTYAILQPKAYRWKCYNVINGRRRVIASKMNFTAGLG